MTIFESEKDQIKAAVMEEAKSFCEMLDFVDAGQIGLAYDVVRYGVKVKIEASVK